MRMSKSTQYKKFGALLRDARKARAWTQGEICARLKVGQQAISSWERGVSRPETEMLVRQIASIFSEHDLEVWLETAGYVAQVRKRSRSTDIAPNPVRPLLATLPLNLLTWVEFQEFCAMLIEFLYPKAAVNQFGREGDTQDGVDIEARIPHGDYTIYQCKRENQFGPADVETAIKKLTVTCDRAVILLSRPASALARKKIATYQKQRWDLWDSNDIARKIRKLPIHRAKRLVDIYFRRFRKAFLGIDDPGAFETTEEYFSPLLHRDRVFSHAWTLIGRDRELKTLLALLNRPCHELTMIVGSGGVGKSRLTRAVAEAYTRDHPDHAVLILPPSKHPLPADFDLLSDQPTLLIVEDAHDQLEHLGLTLKRAAAANTSLRVLITARPYAQQLIRDEASKTGYSIENSGIVALKGLGLDRAQEIAQEILRDRNGPVHAARAIALLTHESPLAVVVGSYLVATDRIHPITITKSEKFRSELFGHFRDAITGTIGSPGDRDTIRATLNLIALLQPIDPERPELRTLAAHVIGRPIDRVIRTIDLLYQAGVLVRRGRVFRIIPDLLADYIIEDSCLSRATGTSSGYIERVLTGAGVDDLTNLLVNVAKLDWRLSEHDDAPIRLIDSVWQHVEAQYKSRSSSRDALIRGIARAAYYQPERALHFFDMAQRLGHEHEKFPLLLKNVAMNFEYVEQACERLWHLGKNDARQLNQYPEHPIRILKELAAVEPNKPAEYCERIVEVALRLLEKPNSSPGAYDLFEVLESALATEGHTSEFQGNSIVMKGFSVRRNAVAAMRRRIIDYLLVTIRSSDPRTAVRAANCFHEALRYPMGVFGSRVKEGDRAAWSSEFVETFSRLKESIAQEPFDPLVLIQLQRAIKWHAMCADEPTKSHANAMNAIVPKSHRYRLTLALVDEWGRLQERLDDYETGVEKWRSELQTIAREFAADAGTPENAVDTLHERISAIQSSGLKNGSSSIFVRILAEQFPDIAETVCARVVHDPHITLRTVFGEALCGLAKTKAEVALSYAHAALDLNDAELTRAVAWAYSVGASEREEFMAEERALLASLVRNADEWIVKLSLGGIAALAEADPVGTLSTLLTVDIGRSGRIADELFSVLLHNKSLPLESLTHGTVKVIFEKLISCPSIENHWVEEFLGKMSWRYPELTLEFLLNRLEVNRRDQGETFRPLPYGWDDRSPLRFRESTAFATCLRKTRVWLFEASKGISRTFWGPRLYAAISAGYDAAIIADLEEWATSSDPEKIGAVAQILRQAPSDFVFSHTPFVVSLIEHAATLGKNCHDSVAHGLWASAISGAKHGTPGEPFPEDVGRRNRSVEERDKLPRGSASWSFFDSLRRSSEADIQLKDSLDAEEFGY